MKSDKTETRDESRFGDMDAPREGEISAREKSEENAEANEHFGIEALVAEFAPFVRRVARRYEGRGAEREDLEQEGYVALISLARRLTRGENIAYVLWSFLPGMVRDAAKRMRWPAGVVRFKGAADEDTAECDDTGEMNVPDERAARDFDEAELRAAIEALPDQEERKIASALSDGLSLGEIAELVGIGRKTLRKRIRSLCRNLGRYLRNID
jgi:RNA polymerase sigma factor (sigma-70 family)